MLAWLSVWSEMQTCIWPSWCHCHPLSLASVKSRLVLPFWYRPTRVVLDKGPFNGCVCVCYMPLTAADGWMGHCQHVSMYGWCLQACGCWPSMQTASGIVPKWPVFLVISWKWNSSTLEPSFVCLLPTGLSLWLLLLHGEGQRMTVGKVCDSKYLLNYLHLCFCQILASFLADFWVLNRPSHRSGFL